MLPLFLAAFVIGVALLAWGGNRFVVGSEATAQNLNIPPIIIGLTIAGFATSAPELLISALASAAGNPGLALGNAVGSNIANIGLVLGLAALVRPLTVHSKTTRMQLGTLLITTVLVYMVFMDLRLSRVEGVVLLVSIVPLTTLLVWLILRSEQPSPVRVNTGADTPNGIGMFKATIQLTVGLGAMLAGAKCLVYGAEALARAIGVNDLVIGLTIVAIGTSLPELAVAISAVLKQKYDLVMGNVIGSNIFNLLAVIGVAGTIAPHELEVRILTVDYPIMAGFTLAIFVLAHIFRKKQQFDRRVGSLLFSAFIAYHGYIAWKIFSA